jgi:hypothetical protein
MRLSRAVLSVAVFSLLVIAAFTGSVPAWSFSVTDGNGLNSSLGPGVAGPSAPPEHIANSGSSIAGGLAASSAGTAAPPAPSATRWQDSWFSHTIIIGGDWKYPPSSP